MPAFPGTPFQEDNARNLIAVGHGLKAPQLALEAMLCLGWGENDMLADGCNNSNHCGIFQLDSTWQGMHDYHDVKYWANYAYTKGFWGHGGIIPLAHAMPSQSPGYITNLCQGAYSDLTQGATYYNQYLQLANETLAALGDTAPVFIQGGGTPAHQSHWELATQRMIDTIEADDWSDMLQWGSGQMFLRSRLGYLDSVRIAANIGSMSVFTEGGGR